MRPAEHNSTPNERTPLISSSLATDAVASAQDAAATIAAAERRDSDCQSDGAEATRTTTTATSFSNTSASDQFPTNQVLFLCFTRLVEPVAFFSIFAYINKMVADTGIEPTDVGFYSGMIESLFSLTQMIVMAPWARLADRIGRKPVLVGSLVGISIAASMFGLARSVWQMILFRCIGGVFAGSIVTVRTMIAENCKREFQPVAYGWFSVASNIGIFLGPLIGGVLADPLTQYPSFPRSRFLEQYPYAIPGFLVGLLGASAALISALFLKETLPRRTRKNGGQEAGRSNDDAPADMSSMDILRSPGVARVLSVYSLMLMIAFAHTAVVPVTLFTPIANGGFSFSPMDISFFMAASGASQTLWLLFCFPWLQKRIGTRACMSWLGYLYPFIFVPFPLGNLLLRTDSDWNKIIFGTTLIFSLCIIPAIAMVFTASQLFINDVSPSPETLGMINALALMIASGIRSFSPALFSTLYALSIKLDFPWYNVFWLLMFMLGIMFSWTTSYLPPEREKTSAEA